MTQEVETKSRGLAPQETHEVASLADYNDDSIVSRSLINTKSGSLTFFAFAAGQRLSEHTAPFDALAHVVDGTAEIVIGGDTFNVEKGRAILMPADVVALSSKSSKSEPPRLAVGSSRCAGACDAAAEGSP